jgi:F-type H+-transporting ATPase subunit delta
VINSTLAKRYALSLVQLGAEAGLVDSFRQELGDIDALFSDNPVLPAVFADPAVSHEQKKSIMRELVSSCACSELVGNFLLLLVDKNRVAFLSQIAETYEALADDHSGILRPSITTAFGLDDAQLASIRETLEKKNAKKIIPRVTVDSTLLGGVVIQIGDTVYDSSVKTQLSRIQDQLQKG